MTDELKPCPFCGSTKIKTMRGDDFPDGYMDEDCFCEMCEKCGATGPTIYRRQDDDDVDWNTRHTPAPQGDAAEAWVQLRDVCEGHDHYDEMLVPLLDTIRAALQQQTVDVEEIKRHILETFTKEIPKEWNSSEFDPELSERIRNNVLIEIVAERLIPWLNEKGYLRTPLEKVEEDV